MPLVVLMERAFKGFWVLGVTGGDRILLICIVNWVEMAVADKEETTMLRVSGYPWHADEQVIPLLAIPKLCCAKSPIQ